MFGWIGSKMLEIVAKFVDNFSFLGTLYPQNTAYNYLKLLKKDHWTNLEFKKEIIALTKWWNSLSNTIISPVNIPIYCELIICSSLSVISCFAFHWIASFCFPSRFFFNVSITCSNYPIEKQRIWYKTQPNHLKTNSYKNEIVQSDTRENLHCCDSGKHWAAPPQLFFLQGHHLPNERHDDLDPMESMFLLPIYYFSNRLLVVAWEWQKEFIVWCVIVSVVLHSPVFIAWFFQFRYFLNKGIDLHLKFFVAAQNGSSIHHCLVTFRHFVFLSLVLGMYRLDQWLVSTGCCCVLLKTSIALGIGRADHTSCLFVCPVLKKER